MTKEADKNCNIINNDVHRGGGVNGDSQLFRRQLSNTNLEHMQTKADFEIACYVSLVY